MKKIGIIFIAAILSLAMTACGRKKDDMATDPKNDNTTAPTILDPTIMDPTLDTNIPDPSVDTSMPDMVEPSEGVSPTR